MCPPHSVKTWPTPACLSVRATRCPPVSSAIGLRPALALLPELLPLDALAVHAFLHEGVANGIDRVAAAAGVNDQPVHAVNEPVHHGVGFARVAAPAGLRLAHRRQIREARITPREGAELSVVEQPGGIADPVDEAGRATEAGLIEIGQDGAHRDDADLLGEEDGAPRIGAIEDEAARRALELVGLDHAEVHLDDVGTGPPDRGDLGPALLQPLRQLPTLTLPSL